MEAVDQGEHRRKLLMIWAAVSIGIMVMASVYDSWTDQERDAFKTGFHDCKEGLPPVGGTNYEDEYQCEAYYEGFWRALEAKKAEAAAAIASGLSAWFLFGRRKE